MPSVTPEELLDSADLLLTAPVAGLGSLWPRACALVIRLALEQSLDRYWARVLPEAAECGMRQQLLLLPLYAPATVTAGGRPPCTPRMGDFPPPIPPGPGPRPEPDRDATSLAREAWRGLARAAHHHVYELAPTALELRRWHTAVSQLNVLLAGEGPGPSS